MNKVLIISTEYPPASRSSGVQRIVNFSRHLPNFGWKTCVLTMHPRAYGKEISKITPDNLTGDVKRGMAFNASTHFSIKGRYFSWMALPDRWSSWVFLGFFSGLRFIKEQKPAVIFASYPHPSALLLAFFLHKVTGIPLVADFRDPMLYLNYSIKGARKKLFQWIEKHVIKACYFAIFTTESAIEEYISVKYPSFKAKYHLIENGFDESDFIEAKRRLKLLSRIKIKQIEILHSGGIFPNERNPIHLFKALNHLKANSVIGADNFKLILRAPGDVNFCSTMLKKYDLEDLVFIYPKINYLDALVEMLSVDGLLVLQGSSCNFQVPAKIYEYFRANKPILALTDKVGETAKLMESMGFESIGSLNSSEEIIHQITRFVLLCSEQNKTETTLNINQQSREARSYQLAKLLDTISL